MSDKLSPQALWPLLPDGSVNPRSQLSEAPMPNNHEPPYDGKPCPMCPIELRNLHAVAHNFLCRWDAWRQHGDGFAKVIEKARDLAHAVELAKPLADAHFADRAHSHPTP